SSVSATTANKARSGIPYRVYQHPTAEKAGVSATSRNEPTAANDASPAGAIELEVDPVASAVFVGTSLDSVAGQSGVHQGGPQFLRILPVEPERRLQDARLVLAFLVLGI